jgi:arylsulfatase A-like enzyme
MSIKGTNPHEVETPMAYSFLYNPIKTEGNELIWDEYIARGIDFLKSREDNAKPFFLYLPTTMPHPPYNALEQFHNMYDVEKVKADLNKPGATKNKPKFMELIRKYRKIDELDEGILEKIYAVYLGMNSYVDVMLGGILDALEETGLSENTTIIVSSDHGDWAGNYNLVEKWPNAMDDDIVRVPLIIKSPNNKSGHVVKEQVEMFDIMPTVMDLAGIQIEHTHFAQSLVEQLSGEDGDKDRAVFCEGGYDEHEPHCSEAYEGPYHAERNLPMRFPDNIYYPKILQQKNHPKSVCRTTMIRTLEYKLVMRTSGDNELYDMKKDSLELYNLYGKKEYESIQMDLERQMLKWYIKTADVVPFTDDPRGFI